MVTTPNRLLQPVTSCSRCITFRVWIRTNIFASIVLDIHTYILTLSFGIVYFIFWPHRHQPPFRSMIGWFSPCNELGHTSSITDDCDLIIQLLFPFSQAVLHFVCGNLYFAANWLRVSSQFCSRMRSALGMCQLRDYPSLPAVWFDAIEYVRRPLLPFPSLFSSFSFHFFAIFFPFSLLLLVFFFTRKRFYIQHILFIVRYLHVFLEIASLRPRTYILKLLVACLPRALQALRNAANVIDYDGLVPPATIRTRFPFASLNRPLRFMWSLAHHSCLLPFHNFRPFPTKSMFMKEKHIYRNCSKS